MEFAIDTKGHYDFINITPQVAQAVAASKIANGLVLVFIPGATAAITTMEYESGLIKDITATLEKIAPDNFDYAHHQRWGDHNGGAHIKAALIGPSLTVPLEDHQLQLGAWQQIVLIDFDETPRQRTVIIKISPSE
ncbi:MAG: secondary thiamine-phosphate synthase enzyme YjbQ [Candidatus Falkowbacteria bacterium]